MKTIRMFVMGAVLLAAGVAGDRYDLSEKVEASVVTIAAEFVERYRAESDESV